MKITDKEILKAFAENDMNVSKTARESMYHRNNIVYHLKKIEKETGLNPFCFFDLVKLLKKEGVL